MLDEMMLIDVVNGGRGSINLTPILIPLLKCLPGTQLKQDSFPMCHDCNVSFVATLSSLLAVDHLFHIHQ